MSANWACTPVGKMLPVQIQRETTPAHVLATCLNLDGFALVGWWVVQIQGEGLDSETNESPPQQVGGQGCAAGGLSKEGIPSVDKDILV